MYTFLVSWDCQEPLKEKVGRVDTHRVKIIMELCKAWFKYSDSLLFVCKPVYT